MNCEEITQFIQEISDAYAIFCSGLDRNNNSMPVAELVAIQQKIESKTDEMFERLWGRQTKAFAEVLGRLETQQKIAALLKSIAKIANQGLVRETNEQTDRVFYEMTQLFSSLDSDLKFDTECYRYFEKYLQSADYEKVLTNMAGNDEIKDIYWSGLSQMLNSIFLNKFMKEDSVLRLEEPIEALADGFGIFLEKGKIYLQIAGDHLGSDLNGAKIYVRKAGKYLGKEMAAGKIFAHKAESAAEDMKGGYLSVTDCEDSIGEGATGGLIYSIEKGEIAEVQDGANIICEKSRSVFSHDLLPVYNPVPKGRSMNYEKIQTRGALQFVSRGNYHAMSETGQMLLFNGSIDMQGINPTENMQNGVLVLYKMIPELGKNMTGGAIIIEIPDLTIAEARKCISPLKKGGAILLRVQMEDGSSRLVDIEDEE